MPGPIRPSEVRATVREILPEEVFQAFNHAISRTWDGRTAVVKQSEIVAVLVSSLGLTREEIFARKLLNVEEDYRDAGWYVDYDKPGFNETYPATFTFKRGRQRPGEVGDEDG